MSVFLAAARRHPGGCQGPLVQPCESDRAVSRRRRARRRKSGGQSIIIFVATKCTPSARRERYHLRLLAYFRMAEATRREGREMAKLLYHSSSSSPSSAALPSLAMSRLRVLDIAPPRESFSSFNLRQRLLKRETRLLARAPPSCRRIVQRAARRQRPFIPRHAAAPALFFFRRRRSSTFTATSSTPGKCISFFGGGAHPPSHPLLKRHESRPLFAGPVLERIYCV